MRHLILACVVVSALQGCSPPDEATAPPARGDSPAPSFRPPQAAIERTVAKLEARRAALAAAGNLRPGGELQFWFHPAGTPVHGTILMFHGFSGLPEQMGTLGRYLHRNGFNVYSAHLAGQALAPADKSWMRVQLASSRRTDLRNAVHKLAQVPALSETIRKLQAAALLDPVEVAASIDLIVSTLRGELSPDQFSALTVARRHDLTPAGEAEFDRATESGAGYAQGFRNYLSDALARLDELDPQIGPVFTVGLSVGGAVALAVAEHSPRVTKCVAFAPFLKIESSDGGLRALAVDVLGPLDLAQFAWDPATPFPWGALTAANRFGSYVRVPARTTALTSKPTLLFRTENEDAADNGAIAELFAAIGGRDGSGFHRMHTFAAGQRVPHPMVPPCFSSQGLVNHYWRPMYQETYRFLTRSNIDPQNLSRRDQDGDPSLPAGFAELTANPDCQGLP
jgi:alpha-beta hydrolase superfamily lysophospholipase